MTKKMDRIAAVGWAERRREIEREDAYRKDTLAKLEVIAPFRAFVLKNEGQYHLLRPIDDWVEELTGHRGWLHSRDSAHQPPPILPPERRRS